MSLAVVSKATLSSEKPILVFYMGYSVPFNGKNYNSKPVYGSEINAIKLGEALSKVYDVHILSNLSPEDEIQFQGVTYSNYFRAMPRFQRIDLLIIVRYINYFLYFPNIASKVFVWVCDMIVNPVYAGQYLHNCATSLIHNVRDHIDGYVCLSDWHFHNVSKLIPEETCKISIIFNPLDTTLFQPNVPIIKNRFIYVSDPKRGLDRVLDCLLHLQTLVPNVSLVVFRKDDMTPSMLQKLTLLRNTKVYGKQPQNVVAHEFLSADYFLYTTHFLETFCNVAAEAQLYNTVCIYNPIGGLTSTIGDRGLALTHDISDPQYPEKVSEDIIRLMRDEAQQQRFRTQGHAWATTLNTPSLAQSGANYFRICSTHMKHNVSYGY